MNETPPLPQPSGATCPNCGAAQNSGIAYCTNCGAALQIARESFWRKALKWILTGVLSLAAVGFGALGACVGFVGFIAKSDPSGAYGSGDNVPFYWAGAALVAMIFCSWLIRVVNKKL